MADLESMGRDMLIAEENSHSLNTTLLFITRFWNGKGRGKKIMAHYAGPLSQGSNLGRR